MEKEIQILNEQIKIRFFANAAIKAIEENMRVLIKEKILEKYEKKIITREGVNYELYDAIIYLNNWHADNLSIEKVGIKLIFFCVSKLPKHKKEIMEKAKRDLFEKGDFNHNVYFYKVPLCISLRYEAELEQILKNPTLIIR